MLLAVVASVFLHGALARALEELPEARQPERRNVVFMDVVRPPPPPPPPEPPPPEPKVEAPKPPPPETVYEAPKRQPPKRTPPKRAPRPDKPPPKELPPPNTERPTEGEPTDVPVFGFDMASTSNAGSGPAMPVGNTLMAKPDEAPRPKAVKKVAPLAVPVQAWEVSTMPTMRGRCQGKYTDEARQAGIEGTVVLDLVVGPDGRTHSIKVLEGLGHGLDKAAITALETCRFKPGTRNGEAVAVRIRAFKIRFFLDDAD